MRLDLFITERYGYTRNKSQSFIKDGLVSVDGKVITKPSHEVNNHSNIELREEKKIHWVSRSAGKLDGFIGQLGMKNCKLRISGATCLDVGSSTGGFTQVLLERGARHVDAVDVGTDQLHPTLRSNEKVTSYEQRDIREFKAPLLRGEEPEAKGGLVSEQNPPVTSGHPPLTVRQYYDLIVCDASFISLMEILPSILSLANNETSIILLWKPQFEVGHANLRKTGVPKDEKIVEEKQKEWEDFLEVNNCKVLQKDKSSVVGEAGNQEWLYFVKIL